MVVYAQCPLCIITTGGGLAIANLLGLPPQIAGIWIGAVTMALAYFVASKSRQKYFTNPFLWSVVFLLLNYFYLVVTNQVDVVLTGMVMGAVSYALGKHFEEFLRTKNNGVAYFPGQRILIPAFFLLASSLVVSLLN